jgi:hypothetical protein
MGLPREASMARLRRIWLTFLAVFGVAALLALRLERGGNGRLQLGERHLARLVVVKLVEELVE